VRQQQTTTNLVIGHIPERNSLYACRPALVLKQLVAYDDRSQILHAEDMCIANHVLSEDDGGRNRKL
jgi:hypothetical protein